MKKVDVKEMRSLEAGTYAYYELKGFVKQIYAAHKVVDAVQDFICVASKFAIGLGIVNQFAKGVFFTQKYFAKLAEEKKCK